MGPLEQSFSARWDPLQVMGPEGKTPRRLRKLG
jgi:hypothetical protein